MSRIMVCNMISSKALRLQANPRTSCHCLTRTRQQNETQPITDASKMYLGLHSRNEAGRCFDTMRPPQLTNSKQYSTTNCLSLNGDRLADQRGNVECDVCNAFPLTNTRGTH